MQADDSNAGRAARASLMPPVTSRPGRLADATPAGGETIAPPFVWRPAGIAETAPVEAALEPAAAELQVAAPAEPVADASSPLEPAPDFYEDEPWALAAVTETEQAAEPEEWSLEPAAVESAIEELTIEPPFAGDTSAADAVVESIDEIPMAEEAPFPLDALIMPEEERPASPLAEAAAEVEVEVVVEAPAAGEAASSPSARTLAERLELISQQLRTGDADTVIGRLAGGDKLDTLLAGLLAGFLAGSRD